MKQCERGHFFDDVRYQECPYCEKVQPAYGSTISVSKEIVEPTATASATAREPEALEPGATAPENSATPAVEPAIQSIAPATPAVEPAAQTPTPSQTTAPAIQAAAPAAQTPTPTPAASAFPAATASATAASAPQEIGATVGVFTSKVGIDPPVAFVVVIDGPDKGASFALKAGRSFIGRGADSDVALPGDEAVSREGHALISYDARKNSFLAASGQGRQISYLNGVELVDPQPIKAYDLIELGRSKLSFLPFCGEEFSWDAL
ncbi:MAG: FHA domain-containing protein [Coriobacteriales bacterium]|jgi:hypothetical protein|nr:FHA domain-containing protein [Coriobacteriales bacterium]